MRKLALALFGAATLIVPAASHAQQSMNSMFQCRNGNGGSGAVIGGLLGGVLGNGIAGDDRRDRIAGTLLGAGVGAAIGSSIGCNMNTADADRAQSATRMALNQNRSTTWSNSRTGVSGRVDIVNSFYRNDVAGRAPALPRDLRDIRFASEVRMPVNYVMLDNSYRASAWLDVFAAPDGNSRVLDQIRDGEHFDGLARVGGWVLAGQNGRAIGYVNERYADYDGRADMYAYVDSDARYGRVADRQLCRTFDQTVRRSGGYQDRERFTACQNRDGEWIVDNT